MSLRRIWVPFLAALAVLPLSRGRGAVCPGLPSGMLNAINQVSKNGGQDRPPLQTLENTPVNVFHNDTGVVSKHLNIKLINVFIPYLFVLPSIVRSFMCNEMGGLPQKSRPNQFLQTLADVFGLW